MVSLPWRLPDSPSAWQNQRSASQPRRHCDWVSRAASRWWRAWARRLPPRTTWTKWPHGRPARQPAGPAVPAAAATSHATPAGTGNPPAPSSSPSAPPAGTAGSRWCGCRPRCWMCASWQRRASAHWSCEALLIDPAHRDDDSGVSSRLRTAHASPECDGPSRHRVLRSFETSDPRYAPTRRSTCSSPGVTCFRRVRTATPPGPDATNDGATLLSPPTPSPPPEEPCRHDERAPPRKVTHSTQERQFPAARRPHRRDTRHDTARPHCRSPERP